MPPFEMNVIFLQKSDPVLRQGSVEDLFLAYRGYPRHFPEEQTRSHGEGRPGDHRSVTRSMNW